MKEYEIQVLIDLVNDILFEDDPRPIDTVAKYTALKQQGYSCEYQEVRKKSKAILESYEEAISKLTDSANLQIIGRQEESHKIMEFLEGAVRACGCSYPLHISGVPGIGKSVTVLKVICELKERHQTSIIPILLNIMNFKNQEGIYQYILERITSGKFDNPQFRLNQLFTNPQQAPQSLRESVNKIKLIIVDQMDQLLKINSKKILYNLLEWTNSPRSQIVFVGISNTVNFAEKLDAKENSRMGNQIIIFRPYSSQQLAQILKAKLRDSANLFEENVLEVVCKKISNQSADVRSLFNICAMAIQKARDQYKFQCRQHDQNHNSQVVLVSTRNIMSFFQSNFQIQMMSSIPLNQKLVLVALYRTIFSNNPTNTDLSDKFTNVLDNLLTKYNLNKTDLNFIFKQFFSLRDLGMLAIQRHPRKRPQRCIMIGLWVVSFLIDLKQYSEDPIIAQEIGNMVPITFNQPQQSSQ